jgi:hypothetical protein
MYVGNNPVTIQIQGESRQWGLLLFYSSIPVGMAILIRLVSHGSSCHPSGDQRFGRSKVPVAPVAIHHHDEEHDIESIRPPAQVPVQPSAPIRMEREEDYGSIPIVEAEYVTPIAAPYLLK